MVVVNVIPSARPVVTQIVVRIHSEFPSNGDFTVDNVNQSRNDGIPVTGKCNMEDFRNMDVFFVNDRDGGGGAAPLQVASTHLTAASAVDSKCTNSCGLNFVNLS